MKELSLHILDIVQNSISAGALYIRITVNEDVIHDRLSITVEDNGKGMEKSDIEKVKDPFYTSRSTRRVGLGVPLLVSAAKRCEGDVDIDSTLGIGTKVIASFKYSHIDRAPLGNLWDTMTGLIVCNENVDFIYTHIYNNKRFELSTVEMKNILKEVPFTSPEVMGWMKDYIKEGIKSLMEV